MRPCSHPSRLDAFVARAGTLGVMKIVIAGSTGFIGSALAASLRRDGHEVLGLSRRPGPDVVQWDLEGGEVDTVALEGLDALVNLAGETIDGRWTSSKKERLVSSRLDSTALLADVVSRLDAPPAVYVGGSAMGFYGSRGDEVLTETSPSGSGFLARLVVDWEAAAAPIAEQGVRVSFARTSLVLGGDGGALPRLRRITKLGAGGPLGNGRQWMSWITLDDEVAALRFMIDHELEGPVNLASPNPVRQREFASVLGGVLRRPTVLPAPAFAIKLVLGEMGESLLLGSTRLAPAALESSGFDFGHRELEPALRSVR